MPATITAGATGQVPPPGRNQENLVEACGWLTGGAGVLLMQVLFWPGDYGRSTILLGILCWLLGVRMFFGHGGALFTVPSIYGFAFSVFFGVGGAYHAVLPSDGHLWLLRAMLVAFAAHVIMFFAYWARRTGPSLPVRYFATGTRVFAGTVGAVAFGVSLLATRGGMSSPELYALAIGAAMAGITLTAVALLMHKQARIVSIGTFLVLVMFLLFVQYIHVGTGRLQIAALGFALCVIYALRFRTIALKVGVIVATPLVLYWMARDRLDLIDTIATGSSAGRTGLESAVRPPKAFGELIYAYHSGGFELSLGRTFLTIPARLIPDSEWPNKPLAFGYELARVTAPEKFGTGYSDASSSLGEWFYNFGYLGLVLMVAIVGLTLPLLDRLLSMAFQVSSEFLRITGMCTMIVICAGVPDLLWSGTHTYGVRTISRLPLLLVLLLAGALAHFARVGERLETSHYLGLSPSSGGRHAWTPYSSTGIRP